MCPYSIAYCRDYGLFSCGLFKIPFESALWQDVMRQEGYLAQQQVLATWWSLCLASYRVAVPSFLGTSRFPRHSH